MNCVTCLVAVPDSAKLKCNLCCGIYHYDCVNMPFDTYKNQFRYEKTNWNCPPCSNVTRRQKGEETPTRKYNSQTPQSLFNTNMSICDDSPENDNSRSEALLSHSKSICNPMEASMGNVLKDTLSAMLDAKLGIVHKDLEAINSKLTSTKQEIFVEFKKEINQAIEKMKQEFTTTTDFLDQQISSFKSDLSTLNKKVQDLSSENTRLNAQLAAIKNSQKNLPASSEMYETINQLKAEINEKDQASLLNDVEISGVPDYKTESTMHIVQTIALKLGLNINERDIVSAYRVGPIRTTNTEVVNSNGNVSPRPRPLVVRLARRALRDELLRSARSRRGLDSSDVGPPDHIPNKLYINERLTRTNRSIFWKGRQAANAANWKYVWTREGRIYAKQSDNSDSKPVIIKSESDISRVFGVFGLASTSSASK